MSETKKREYWSMEEDLILNEGIEKYGKKWSKIGKEYPHLVEKHNARTSLRDRAVVLEKHKKAKLLKMKVTDEIFESMPDSSRTEWSNDEDEALKEGYGKYGMKWQQIWTEFGGILKRHKKENLRYRIIALQKKQLQETGVVEERLSTLISSGKGIILKDEKITTIGTFTCDCGNKKKWTEMLISGIKCICNRDLGQMLKQIEEQIGWVVYVIIDENNEEGLTGKVNYVGTSEHLSKRVSKGHDKKVVRDVTFFTLRASIFLGESQLIKLLSPKENIQMSGNKNTSDSCRLWNKDNFDDMNIGLKGGDKYESIKEYTDLNSKKNVLQREEHFESAGLIFTNVGRCVGRDETKFCFLKDAVKCECGMKCSYRKILNNLKGREIWHGILLSEVKDTVRPYREVIKVVKGEKNPIWSKEYCERVIRRNTNIQERTTKDYLRKVNLLWESGILSKEKFERPWDLLSDLRRRGTRNTVNSEIVILMSLLSHITNLELLLMFGGLGINLRMEYMRIQKELFEEGELELQRKSLRERKNWAKMSEIEDAVRRMELDVKTVYDYQRVVWYMMQIWMGPARNEWQTLKVSDWDPEVDNYVNMEEGVIVLNRYKTCNAMGRRVFEIKEEVLNYMERLVKRRLDGGSKYMFVKMNGEIFMESEFSGSMIRGMEKYMGKKIGSQMQRKIYVSEAREGEKSILEKRELSGRMLHSSGMSEKYRRL